MPYVENPKTKGSGIVCCIPQEGVCPIGCEDCFFMGGRSYLEPIDHNLPNMPDAEQVIKRHQVVRVNDGNDSNIGRRNVVRMTRQYPLRFYNTSIPNDIGGFDSPVVLTLNPGKMTDDRFHKLEGSIPVNLMFVRFRVNSWNISDIGSKAVDFYTSKGVPVVFTFMAYFDTATAIPEIHKDNYIFRRRVLNSYWAITTKAWLDVMDKFRTNKLVYSCGHIEGELGDTKCKYCGNCIREFFAARERMREQAGK